MGNICLIRSFQAFLHTCLTLGTENMEMGQARPPMAECSLEKLHSNAHTNMATVRVSFEDV